MSMSYRYLFLLFFLFSFLASSDVYADKKGKEKDNSNDHRVNKKDDEFHKDKMKIIKNSNMMFGTVEFSRPYRGILIMGTNGVASIRGRNLALGGVQQPGHIKIMSTSDSVLEVRCSSRDTLKDQYGNRIRLYNAEISLNTGRPYRRASSCGRHNRNIKKGRPALKIDLSSNPNPSIYMGALLYISSRSGLEDGGSYVSTKGINMSFVFQ